MIKDGPRRKGRFIKKGSPVSNAILLQDFSFSEINTVNVISHDNMMRSIIHTSYHEPASVKQATRQPDNFDHDLMDDRDRRPVLTPLDFTRDWSRSAEHKSGPAIFSEDEDDFDYEAAVLAARRNTAATAEQADFNLESHQQGDASFVANSKNKILKATDDDVDVSASSADQAVAVMEAAGFKFAKNPNAQSIQDQNTSIPNNSDEEMSSAVKSDEMSGSLDAEKLDANEFIPISSGEREASDEYHRRSSQRKIDEQELANLEEEAKAKGYREGFGLGEEKGLAAARQNAAALFGKVSELVHELDKLQKGILDQAQSNFYEICQAMAEALFRREFTIHPESFVEVVKRAIDEAADSQRVTIRLHPDMYNRISELGIKDLDAALIKDPTVDETDFRVESEQAVIEGSLSKIIRDLLNQADLNILESSSPDLVSEIKKDAG